MVENNKLVVLDKNLKNSYLIKNNKKTNIVFLVFSKFLNNLEITFDIENNCELLANFIIIANNSNNLDIKVDGNIIGNINNVNINFLCYGLDESKTNITSNFIVNKNTIDNKLDQQIKGILLSSKCKILGEPNLKINSLEVKAKHSLNIGFLNPDELFYLQSKTIDIESSKKILINSYLNSFIYGLNEKDKEICNNLILENLK